MPNSRMSLGRWGEDRAAEYLQGLGYSILARNVRTAHGEIDLVAAREGLLLFVEVKTRRSHAYSYPEDAVTFRKQAFLLSAAQEYLEKHPDSPESWQFDVIAIEGTPNGQVHIEHFENVIS